MSEPTQPIDLAGEVPRVRELHASEQELIDLVLENLAREEEGSVREHLNTCGSCRERLEALHLEDGNGATRVRDPLVGAMLGEYRVEAALARGGMGVVYRGLQPMIGKPVAIKVLIPEMDDDESINRLLDEARAVNAIRHPNIIDIFSFGSLPGGRHYFVMELLDGKSFEDLINERRTLSPDEVMTVLEQTCSALGAAHLAGVVHRDLKPANLFLSVLADGGWHVTVLDFGLAKRLGNTRKTATNIVMGTPGYMAPEQIRGKAVGAQTDLYALGVVAWVLLTGREPFQAEGIMDLLRAHIDAPLPSLRALAPQAPEGLVTLIERLLAKRPEDRPGSALKVRESIQQLRTVRGAVSNTPLVRNPRKQGFIPAGMPSSELEDGVADTAIRKAPVRPSPAARAHVDVTHVGPAPAGTASRGAGRVVVGAALVAGLGAALVFRLAATSGRPPPPTNVAPPVESQVVLPAPPSAPPPAPTPAALPSAPLPPPTPAVTAPEVGVEQAAAPPRSSVVSAIKPNSAVKTEPPVDPRKRLASRLEKLEKRFAQALARGSASDLEFELAEVRALRQGLATRTDQQSIDAIETAVQRLEGIKP